MIYESVTDRPTHLKNGWFHLVVPLAFFPQFEHDGGGVRRLVVGFVENLQRGQKRRYSIVVTGIKVNIFLVAILSKQISL